MTIAVAYKWAPNPQDAVVGADGSVDWSRAKSALSEYDQVAVEVARRLADATSEELVGLSVGGTESAGPLARKAALSRGLDRLVQVADDSLEHAGTVRTATVLAALVQHLGDVSLVVAGDSSVDVGAQMVPSVLAGALGRPVLSNVSAVAGTTGDLTVTRAADSGGTQVLRVTGPAVLAVASDAVVPRVPGMKDILAAGKRPAETVDLATVEPAGALVEVTTTGTAAPVLAARKQEVIDGADPAAAAAALVAALRADGLL
jgi:electron transfer flavoprotein beta subunit